MNDMVHRWVKKVECPVKKFSNTRTVIVTKIHNDPFIRILLVYVFGLRLLCIFNFSCFPFVYPFFYGPLYFIILVTFTDTGTRTDAGIPARQRRSAMGRERG